MICQTIWFIVRASSACRPALRVWLSWLSAGVRYRVVRWKYRRCGRSSFLVPQSRCPPTHLSVLWSWCFVTSREGWTGDGERWHMLACPVYAIICRVGKICWIVIITAFCTVAILYPVFKSSPTTGQKTVAPSISLWRVFHLFVRLLNFLCVLNIWLAFGVVLFSDRTNAPREVWDSMVVGMWGCVLGCDAV